MSSIMKGLVDEQDIEETKKLSAQEKFKRSMARAGYDMDAGAKRLQDLLAKQKKEREEFEKKEKEIKEDETLQYAAEVTPKVSPYAGVKDRKFRGAIGEAVKQLVENPNESPTDAGYQEGGWRKMNEEELDEDLRKWFKEKWVRFGPDGKIRGACARGSSSEGKPKCLPQAKAHALGKKGRKYAAAKKRREDPNPERSGPAKNVATKKKSNEGIQENMQANYKNYSTQDLLRMIKTIKRDEIGMKIIKAISNELIRRKEGVAEGLGKNVVKSVKVGNFRHDLVDTGMGWQVRIYNGDELYDTGMSKNSEQKGLAALEDAVAYTEKQTRTKRQGVAEGSLNELFEPQIDYYQLANGKIIQASYRPLPNLNATPGTVKISYVNPALKPQGSSFDSTGRIERWDKAPDGVKQEIQKFVNNPNQGVAEGVYTVAPGDNLSTLARKYGTTVDALLKMNPNIKNANLMQAGIKLNVPDVANTPQGAVSTGSNTSIQPNTRNKAANFVKGLPSSDKEISSIIKSGPGFIEVKTVDGEAQRRKGDANWRMNNPGNLRVSSWTKQQPGYVGVGDAGPNGKFAVFATLDDGRQAKKNLLFGAQSPYINLSIKDAITKYAPPSENRTDTYINQVVQGIKASPDTTLNKLSQQQQNAMLDIITKLEGFKIGSIEKIPTVAEGYSDMSGLMSASNLNNSYIITAELAEGGKKRFRVKAQNERVAIEKFKKHHSMANIISVKEEGVSEGSKYPRNPASYHLKKYPVPPEQMVRPIKKQKVKPNEKPEQKPEEKLDELKCWPGYSRVKGVPAGAPGSCKKKTVKEDIVRDFLFKVAKQGKPGMITAILNSPQHPAHKLVDDLYLKAIDKGFNPNMDMARIEDFVMNSLKRMFGMQVTERQQCPECGGNMYEVSLMNEKKDACYYKVKSRYKVWPSAYASGALVKCRKKGAKNWGTKTEGQIYSTGGGAGEAQRWYRPKDNLGETSSILEGIQQVDEVNWKKWAATGALAGAAALSAMNPAQARVSPQDDGSMSPSFAQQVSQNSMAFKVIKDIGNGFEQVNYKGMNGVRDTENGKIILISKIPGNAQIVTIANGKETTDYVDMKSLGNETKQALQSISNPVSSGSIPKPTQGVSVNGDTLTFNGKNYDIVKIYPNGPSPRLSQIDGQVNVSPVDFGIRSVGVFTAKLKGNTAYVYID